MRAETLIVLSRVSTEVTDDVPPRVSTEVTDDALRILARVGFLSRFPSCGNADVVGVYCEC